MNLKHLPLLAGLSLATLAPAALAQQDISKVNGNITADGDQRHGDLDTVNGSIKVEEGAETGDIETVNGGIRVAARARTGSISTVNGSIRLAPGTVTGGGVETVNGSIFVDRGSRIAGNIETVNGGIGLVATQVSGDVETVNGDITVGVDSSVSGGIQVHKPSFSLSLTPGRKPRVIIGPRAVVSGSLQFERDVVLQVHRSARVGAISGAEALYFDSETAPEP